MKAPGFWWARKAGWRARLLAPAGACVGAVAARRMARPHALRLNVPVICVGNPTVGGAGKTPIAIALAHVLRGQGERPAFLTRGYGGRLKGPVVVAPSHTARDVGDEPLLLASVAPTVVSANRALGGPMAAQDASVVIMDDGFQNPALYKDFSILVVDAVAGVGNGRVTPAGPLRAPLLPQVAAADAIALVHGSEPAPPLDLPAGPARYGVHLRPSAPIDLSGVRALAFAGIGRPEKFFASARALGADLVRSMALGDHAAMGEQRAKALMREAERDDLTVLTTEKDRVRLMAGGAAERALAAAAVCVSVEAVLDPALVAAVRSSVARVRSAL